MNTTTTVIGAVVLLYGLMMLVTRFTRPDKHIRLGFLTRTLGNKIGNIIYTLVYIIAPFALAYVLINNGLDGSSLKEIFTPPPRPE